VNNAGDKFIKTSSEWVSSSVDDDGSKRQANWSKTDGSSVCPTGYRVPTEAELTAETTGAGVGNRDDAFNSFLKLPSSGNRGGSDGILRGQGSWGDFWTASVDGSGSRYLEATSSATYWDKAGRTTGMVVRCLKN